MTSSITPAVTYAIQRSTDGATFTTQASGLYGLFWMDEAPAWPTASFQNWYRVVASDGLYSATGAAVAVSVPAPVPQAPSLSQPAGTTNVLATWAPMGSLVTGYQLQRSIDNLAWQTIASGGSSFTSYTDMTLAPWARYYYRLIAVTAQGSASGPSASIIVLSTATPPAGYRFVLAGIDASLMAPAIQVLRDPPPRVHRQIGHQRGEASFGLGYEGNPPALQQWQSVLIWDGPQLIFQGWLTAYDLKTMSPSRQDVTITAQDASGFLSATLVDEAFEGISTGLAIKALVSRYIPALTTNNVNAGPVLPYTLLSRVTLDQAIMRILTQAAAQSVDPVFSIDANLDMHLSFAGSLPNAPFQLGDSNPYSGSYP